jgi:hypothetical protein
LESREPSVCGSDDEILRPVFIKEIAGMDNHIGVGVDDAVEHSLKCIDDVD